MKKILSTLILSSIIVFANKTYTISTKEYQQYKKNPSKMEQIFKDKYIYKKKKKIKKKIIKKVKIKKIVKKEKVKSIIKVKSKKIEIIKVLKVKKDYKKITKKKKKKSIVNIVKIKEYYTLKEVNNKLIFDNIVKSKNIIMLKKSIKRLFQNTNNNYEIREILFTIDQIHNKKISEFESEIYLKQITKILKDIN